MLPNASLVFLNRSRFLFRQSARTKFLARNLLKLNERSGLIQDSFPPESTQRLAQFLEENPRTIYAGFDPTSDSLHIGNLLVMMGLLHAQRSGHQPIALIGGATAQIGDPSGKTSERPAMSLATINQNISGLKANLEAVFHNHETFIWNEAKTNKEAKLKPVIILNNGDWYKDINIIQFLREYGRHFRMNKLLSRESVKSRLTVTKADPDGGMSYTEFSYQIFQAYDWLHLNKEYGCSLQLGGSDQMGNIVSGYELITRVDSDRRKELFGLLLPLVTSETGDKFGKSAGAPVWLAKDKTSPFDFYQFFIRLPDSQLEKMLHYFTFLSTSHIMDLMNSHWKEPEKRKAQTKLAEQLTILVHGKEGLDLAKKSTSILFSGDDVAQTLAVMSRDELSSVFSQSPYVRLLFTSGLTMLKFAMKIGCFRTEKDAIRIIDAGGFNVNQFRCRNTDEIIMPQTHILPNNLTLVRVGKKNYYIVEWTF